jgi:uncharacterized protein YutE (UPF0331/DUF86 family)
VPDYSYARGRISESIQYITEEIEEFSTEYATKTWQEYTADKKLQKLIDKTVENILTALIEVCGTLLTEENISTTSYSQVLEKAGHFFGFSKHEQELLAKLAMQRNRLVHRYLNFRWQAVQMFANNKDLVLSLLNKILDWEQEKK